MKNSSLGVRKASVQSQKKKKAKEPNWYISMTSIQTISFLQFYPNREKNWYPHPFWFNAMHTEIEINTIYKIITSIKKSYKLKRMQWEIPIYKITHKILYSTPCMYKITIRFDIQTQYERNELRFGHKINHPQEFRVAELTTRHSTTDADRTTARKMPLKLFLECLVSMGL